MQISTIPNYPALIDELMARKNRRTNLSVSEATGLLAFMDANRRLYNGNVPECAMAAMEKDMRDNPGTYDEAQAAQNIEGFTALYHLPA